MDLEARVLKVFKEVLEIHGEVDTSSLRYNETPNWRSLAHITLVSALEGEFDMMLEPDDIVAMSNYDKAVKIVRKASNAG
jgi:acyl carrier protein